MKFSDYVLIFLGIVLCFGIISFVNVDITKKVNTQRVSSTSSKATDTSDTGSTKGGE